MIFSLPCEELIKIASLAMPLQIPQPAQISPRKAHILFRNRLWFVSVTPLIPLLSAMGSRLTNSCVSILNWSGFLWLWAVS
jgi:hypothetical protein